MSSDAIVLALVVCCLLMMSPYPIVTIGAALIDVWRKVSDHDWLIDFTIRAMTVVGFCHVLVFFTREVADMVAKIAAIVSLLVPLG